jgi:hypothetical protein
MQSLSLLSAAALLSAALGAQSLVHVPDAQLQDRPVNMIPFGSHENAGSFRTQRYQTLIPQSYLGNQAQLISEIGFAPQTQGRHIFDRILVRLTQTQSSQLVADFANNLGTQSQVVLFARDYHWQHDAGQWSSIGLERPFYYTPSAGNLLIDIEVYGARSEGGLPEAGFYRAENVQRVYAVAEGSNPLPSSGRLSTGGLLVQIAFDLATTGAFGQGCQGSNGKAPRHVYSGTPALGQRVQSELHDALPGTPGMMFLGLSVDGRLFPLPLAGTTGCQIYLMPLTVTPIVTTAGTTSLPIDIPLDLGMRTGRFYTQFLTLDPAANQAGFTTSNYVRILLGS